MAKSHFEGRKIARKKVRMFPTIKNYRRPVYTHFDVGRRAAFKGATSIGASGTEH